MAEKVCVVVGAGPGIGLAVARKFHAEGYTVGLIARRPEALNTYVAKLGTGFAGFVADAADPNSLAEAFVRIKADLGPVETLVYNAAALSPGMPTAVPVERLINEFTINVAGALASVQAVAPDMRTAKRGTILFTGGGLALKPWAQYASLAIGKSGIRSLAFTLGQELGPEGIHVATVTVSGFVQPGTHFDPDRIAEVYWNLHSQTPDAWQTEIVFQ